MAITLGLLSVVIAGLLIFVVVIQNSKGGGLSSSFGGGGSTASVMGARRSNEAIEKMTWYLAAAIAILAFLINTVGITPQQTTGIVRSSNISDLMEDYRDGNLNQAQEAPAVETPAAPVEGTVPEDK